MDQSSPGSSADQPNTGTIGVRCARNRRFLWFTVPAVVCSSEANLYDEISRAINTGRGSYRDLESTDAITLVRGLRRLRLQERFKAVAMRPTYFSLEVADEQDWRELLPRIVELIRAAFGLPDLPVSIQPPRDSLIESWHRRLLEELFGPLAA